MKTSKMAYEKTQLTKFAKYTNDTVSFDIEANDIFKQNSSLSNQLRRCPNHIYLTICP